MVAGVVDAIFSPLSGRLLVATVVQAVRTADAAASEKVRRLKRGADEFNDFSNNGAGSCEDHRAVAFHANRIASGDRHAPQSGSVTARAHDKSKPDRGTARVRKRYRNEGVWVGAMVRR